MEIGQKISHIPTEIDNESEKEGYSTVSYLDGKATATLPNGLEYNIELEGEISNTATINVEKNTTIELTRKDKDRFNFSINGEFKLPEIYEKANALESMLEDYTIIGASFNLTLPPFGGGFGLRGFKSYNRVTGKNAVGFYGNFGGSISIGFLSSVNGVMGKYRDTFENIQGQGSEVGAAVTIPLSFATIPSGLVI